MNKKQKSMQLNVAICRNTEITEEESSLKLKADEILTVECETDEELKEWLNTTLYNKILECKKRKS